jgi:flagellar basal body rod protein FlgB
MSIFDGINVAEQAISVHRYRSEVAAYNLSHAYDPGYKRKVVDIDEGNFSAAMSNATQKAAFARSNTSIDTTRGAVRVIGVHTDGTPMDERSQAMAGIVEMYRSKTAYDMSIKTATLLKSMALASLEIGRGG